MHGIVATLFSLMTNYPSSDLAEGIWRLIPSIQTCHLGYVDHRVLIDLLHDGNLTTEQAVHWFGLCLRIWRRDESNAVTREAFVQTLLLQKFDILVNILSSLPCSPEGCQLTQILLGQASSAQPDCWWLRFGVVTDDLRNNKGAIVGLLEHLH